MNHAPRILDIGNVNSLAIISDVHLDQRGEKLEQSFLNALESIKNVEVLVLLGDIFDFVFAKKLFYAEHWSQVLLKLKELRATGVKIYFVEGNHDFGFEHCILNEFKSVFEAAGDFILIARHKHLGRVEMRHGDDIVCQPSYLKFRSVVKSALFQGVFSIVPGFLLHQIFSKYAKVSRKKDVYRKLDSEFLKSSLLNYFNLLQNSQMPKADTLVFGHIHVFCDNVIESTRFLSGPDWLSCPSILQIMADGAVLRLPATATELPQKFVF